MSRYFQQAARQPGAGVAILRPPNRIFRRWELMDPGSMAAPRALNPEPSTPEAKQAAVPLESAVGIAPGPTERTIRPGASTVERPQEENRVAAPQRAGEVRSHLDSQAVVSERASIVEARQPETRTPSYEPSFARAQGERQASESGSKASVEGYMVAPRETEAAAPSGVDRPVPRRVESPTVTPGIAEVLKRPETAARRNEVATAVAKDAGHTVHIGTIEVRVTPPPAPPVAPVPPRTASHSAPRTAMNPAGPLSRGFASRFGWTQG